MERARLCTAGGPGHVGPMRAEQIMSSPVHTLSPADRLEDAGRLMLRRRISAVPLTVSSRMLGLVTDTDLLRCYLGGTPIGPRTDWQIRKVQDIMSAHVFTLGPRDATATARKLMQRKCIRHLPIAAADRLVGIISDRDLLRTFFRDHLDQVADADQGDCRIPHVALGDIMSDQVESVGPGATLADAADRMLQFKIGALPVVRGKTLTGILTQTDLLQAFVEACGAHVRGAAAL